MKLGFSTWGMASIGVDEALEGIAGLGYDGVELTVLPGYTTALDDLDDGERARILQLLAGHGLDLPAVSGHRSLLASGDAHADNWRRLTGAIDLCAAWSIDGATPVLDTVLGGGIDWDEGRDFVVERVQALAEYAARHDVVVGLEAHRGSTLDTPEKARWLVEHIDSPHLRLNFDISHFDVLGIPTADSVASLVPFSAHTHVKDQRGSEFLTPGEGDFDYADYLRHMAAAGYDGYITVEIARVVQRRPDYDAFGAAQLAYRTLARAFDDAGVSR